MELSKVVPQLVREFDFVPENGIPEWTTENVWFVKPKGFKCHIKSHDVASTRGPTHPTTGIQISA